jgi:flagellar biosynthesis/type III secretory pathway ATPase
MIESDAKREKSIGWRSEKSRLDGHEILRRNRGSQRKLPIAVTFRKSVDRSLACIHDKGEAKILR